MSKTQSTNYRGGLTAQSTITGQQEYLTSTNHILNSTASITPTSLPIAGATSAIGVAIVDSSGNQISSFGGGTQYASGSTQLTPTGNAFLGQYSTTLPTITTNGALQVAQFDSNGRILTNPGALTAATDTITSFQGGAWTVAATQSGAYNVGTATRAVSTGQTNLATSSTALSVISTASTNGILVRALLANTGNVYIGATGVTASNGYELAPGETVVFTASNITAVFGVNTNGTDDVCWSVT